MNILDFIKNNLMIKDLNLANNTGTMFKEIYKSYIQYHNDLGLDRNDRQSPTSFSNELRRYFLKTEFTKKDAENRKKVTNK
jgi:hypothetical protein